MINYDELAAKLFSALRGVNLDANMIDPGALKPFRLAVESLVDDVLDEVDGMEERFPGSCSNCGCKFNELPIRSCDCICHDEDLSEGCQCDDCMRERNTTLDDAIVDIVGYYLGELGIPEAINVEVLNGKYNIGLTDINQCDCGCDCEEQHMMQDLLLDDLHEMMMDIETRVTALETRSESECTEDCCTHDKRLKDVIKSLYINATSTTDKRKLDGTDGKSYDF